MIYAQLFLITAYIATATFLIRKLAADKLTETFCFIAMFVLPPISWLIAEAVGHVFLALINWLD